MHNENNIFYVTSDNEPADIIFCKLESRLRGHTQMVSMHTLENILVKGELNWIVLQYSTAIHYAWELEALCASEKNCFTIILSAPENISTSEVVQLGRLRGLFYQPEGKNKLKDGINRVLNGHYQLPSKITYKLLAYYQSVILRHTEPHFTNLTHREIEVLKYLKEGLSNTQLSEELFVSEHTVKSHLYKIFKKIDVRNRNQAIAWAHKFLP